MDINEISSHFSNFSLSKPYLRKQIEELDKEKEKKPLNSESIKKIFNEKLSFTNFKSSNPNHLTFYFSNSESINDYSWGSSWRAIQIILSYLLSIKNSLNKYNISFKNLFLKYGERTKLINLFKKDNHIENNNIPNYLDKPFCPFETIDGFADPFISKLILLDFNFGGELLLINDYPKNSYSPKEVFNLIINFEEFVNLLEVHFSDENSTPIFINDGTVSLIISGISVEDNFVYFIIFDPNVKINENSENGIYYIKLCKDGVFDKNENNQPHILGMRLHFKTKSWMVFVPENL